MTRVGRIYMDVEDEPRCDDCYWQGWRLGDSFTGYGTAPLKHTWQVGEPESSNTFSLNSSFYDRNLFMSNPSCDCPISGGTWEMVVSGVAAMWDRMVATAYSALPESVFLGSDAINEFVQIGARFGPIQFSCSMIFQITYVGPSPSLFSDDIYWYIQEYVSASFGVYRFGSGSNLSLNIGAHRSENILTDNFWAVQQNGTGAGAASACDVGSWLYSQGANDVFSAWESNIGLGPAIYTVNPGVPTCWASHASLSTAFGGSVVQPYPWEIIPQFTVWDGALGFGSLPR